MVILIYCILYIVSVGILLLCIKKVSDENFNPTRLDKIGNFFNNFFMVLYTVFVVPFLLAGSMSSTMTLGIAGPIYIAVATFFSYYSMFLPVIGLITITLSTVLRRKNKHISSFIVQFFPIVLFIVCACLLAIF